MRFKPFPILKTERLILRKITFEDAKALFDYQSDKNNFPYINMKIYEDMSEVEEYITKIHNGTEEDKWILWVITLAASGDALGTISIWNFENNKSTAEFGYGLFAGFRHQGYMKEALECCLEYGFEKLDMMHLEAYTNPKNKPSVHLLEKTGFEYRETIDEDGDQLAVYVKNKLSQE